MSSTQLVSPASRRRRQRRSGRPTAAEAEQLDHDVHEHALKLFLEHGYDGTSMDAIASAARTTKVSVYARFKNKEELFHDVLWWALRRPDWPEPETAVPDMDDLADALLTIAEGAIRRALHPAMVKLSRIAAAHALRFPEIARRTHALGFSQRSQVVVDVLKRHAATGAIVTEDVGIAAEHFLAMVSGAPARLASFGIVWEAAAQQRRLRMAVHLFVRGLRPD
jgi:AcrR family transcriptional regulator